MNNIIAGSPVPTNPTAVLPPAEWADRSSATCLDASPAVLEAQILTDLKAIAARREREGLLAEQRHQLLDLDADSAFTIPGACCRSYLTAGGQS